VRGIRAASARLDRVPANVPSSLSLKSTAVRWRAVRRPERVLVQGHAFRLPTSRDLAAVVHEPDETVAARRLLQQCAEENCRRAHERGSRLKSSVRAWPRPTRWRRSGLVSIVPAAARHFEESLDLPSFIWRRLRRWETVADAGAHASFHFMDGAKREILSLSPGPKGISTWKWCAHERIFCSASPQAPLGRSETCIRRWARFLKLCGGRRSPINLRLWKG